MVSPGEHIALEFLKQAKPKPGSSVLDIGTGTGRGAFNLAVFGGLKVKMLDFAANCLDEDIRPMLETQKDTLSFEQVDITEGIPQSAEYGFCTDVLEHIPPTEVDKVIDNCLKACQHVFFQISTVDDVCGAAIGHPLHLTVKPYEWWLKKFTDRDCAVHWSRKDSISCCFYVSAWTDAKEFSETGLINVPDGTFLANVKENIKNGWKQVSPHEANDFELMILGGGPSLNEFEDEIREKQKAGIKIVTLNGAYNWCAERGIGPVTQIMVDAREFNKRFVQPID